VRDHRQEAAVVRRIVEWIVAGVVLLLARHRGPEWPRKGDKRIVAAGTPERRAETVLLLLLGLVVVCCAVFIAVYSVNRLAHQTQYLGLALGGAFIVLAAACILVANKLIVSEELEHPYPPDQHPEASEIEQIVAESGSRFTRGRLVTLAGAGALGAIALAIITPVLSLGPALATEKLKWTPWRRGRRLVDQEGAPLRADDIVEGSFTTAYPEGGDRELMGAPLVVVRVAAGDLKSRHDWAPQGIVAFSKICTHAGCAISLYRKPTFAPVEPRAALVCPCHYSTFDPADGGKVLFGPAGRALPQLPLEIDANGFLRAKGNFDGQVGPSWWGVRKGKATTS
jgi:ubiquinol-cytochrome c reductase iron-sulfur subunit